MLCGLFVLACAAPRPLARAAAAGGGAAGAGAAEGEWAVGIASIKITPQRPVPLAGYAARTQPFEKVDQDLYAKALALKDGRGNRAVLVTMDLCILPPDVGEGARSRISEKTGIDAAAVVLAVSHSHSAPAVALRPRPAAAPATNPAPANEGTVDYTRQLQEKLVAVAEQALAQTSPARLSWGAGVAHFAMNRREFTDRGVILGVNPRGLVDRSVPVLRVDSPDRKVRAVLFGYACHNTTLPSRHLGVSGDYAGYAKAHVEKQFPGAEAMFLMGCGGDANPHPRQEVAHAAAHGEELGKEVCRVLEAGKLQPVRGPLSCASVAAVLPLQTPDRQALEAIVKDGAGGAGVSNLNRQTARQMLATLDAGGQLPATYKAPVTAWQFGRDLTLVALPDEVVVDYVPRLEEALGPLRLWVAAYCHEVAGYIPSKRVLREGGYETRGLYFGTGLFAEGVEDALVDAVREAATKAGRETPQKSGR
jgi:hypothetical protein